MTSTGEYCSSIAGKYLPMPRRYASTPRYLMGAFILSGGLSWRMCYGTTQSSRAQR